MSNVGKEELEQALRQCESEPIHQIGQIQPHGALLVLSPDSRRIVLQASSNLEEFFDQRVAVVCGNPLAEVIGATQAEQIEQLIQEAMDNNPAAKVVSFAHQPVKHNLQARVFLSGNMFVLELMRDLGVDQGQHIDSLLQQFQRSLLTVNAEKDTYRYFDRVATVVRELTEFDRVMVYRFDAHWDGEVIAESRVESAHSYLGTRFPASDIPPQARQLYTRNAVRQIADVNTKNIPVLPALNPVTQQPLDMTYSVLRSLSPVHVEYLRNMGVSASMSISLLQSGRLWGLIACHHMTPKQVPYAMQEAAAFVSEIVSTRLSLTEVNEQRNLGTDATRIIGELLKSITASTGDDLQLTLVPDLQVLLGATGIVMVVEGKHYVHGAVPKSDDLSGLFTWLCAQPATDVFGCDCLAKELVSAASYADIASGILVAPLSSDMRNSIIWLRKERIRTVQWAGSPEKVLSRDRKGVHLSPRKSFEDWTETWRGRCDPWSNSETETARSIAQILTQGLSQNSKLKLEQQKSQQANEALNRIQLLLKEAEQIGSVGGWEFFLDDGKLTWTKGVYDIHEVDADFDLTVEKAIDFYTSASRPVIEQAIRRAAEHGEPYDLELEIVTAKGNLRNVHAKGSVDSERRRVFGFFQDITARKQAERALVALREDAEAANRAKSDFLATMSHELRTPLNAVVGLAGLLASSPLSRRQHDYANKITLSAQALRILIDDILDYSKIEAGELRLEHAPFSLDAILRTTAAVIGVNLGHKPIETFFDVGPDIPDTLIGDALRLQQILLNLTSNAVKFTSTGVIVVSVHRFPQKNVPQDGQFMLRVCVRDTGIGVAPEQLGSIFDAFAQANASTSRMYGGTGLGLSISARLAALMGGQIGVQSTLGQGSEFCLEVPLTVGRGAPQAAPEGIPAALSILIVDDNPLACDILTRTCIAFGWQASAVNSGAAGLQELYRSAAAGHDYDLLLLDWHMPGMNGLEMLRQAHTTPGIGLPLVVLMTPIFELELAVAASDDIELDAIATKPMLPSSLLEAVTRAYSGDYAASLPLAVSSDQRLAGLRLLVAEDNQLNQEVIEQILIRAGAKVVLVGDGVAAVAALRLGPEHFDAVLMDIQMPLMDGYTATRIIREELGLVDLPIIAVSAFAQPQDLEKSRLAGMVGHVVKPLNVEDLLDLLMEKRRSVVELPTERQDNAQQNITTTSKLLGLDIAAGLKAFGGDATKFGGILRKFVLQHGGDVGAARHLVSVHDPEAAIRLLHDLIGVASLLQAHGLAHLSRAAEEALRSNNAEAMPVLFDKLQVAMDSVKVSFHQFEVIYAGT